MWTKIKSGCKNSFEKKLKKIDIVDKMKKNHQNKPLY